MAQRLKSPLCVRLTTLSWCCIVGACGDDGTAGAHLISRSRPV